MFWFIQTVSPTLTSLLPSPLSYPHLTPLSHLTSLLPSPHLSLTLTSPPPSPSPLSYPHLTLTSLLPSPHPHPHPHLSLTLTLTHRVYSAYTKEIEDKPEATCWGKKMPFGNLMAEYSNGRGEKDGAPGMQGITTCMYMNASIRSTFSHA